MPAPSACADLTLTAGAVKIAAHSQCVRLCVHDEAVVGRVVPVDLVAVEPGEGGLEEAAV